MGLSINTKSKTSEVGAIFQAALGNELKDNNLAMEEALIMFQDDTIQKAKKSFINEEANLTIYKNDYKEEKSPFMRIKDFDNSYKFKQKFTNNIIKDDFQNMSIGDFGKGVLFNQWADTSQKVNRADGSILVPTEILSDIVYKASQHSVLLGNCPIMVMNAPTVIIGKVSDDIELDFKEKGKEGIETDLGLEGIKLEAKTLYAYIKITEEDLQDVENLDSILTNAFSMAVAKALDDNFLYTNPKAESNAGVYPKGILDNENIKKIELTDIDYNIFANANLEIAKCNGRANTVGFNPLVDYQLQTQKDATGQYINPPQFFNDLTKISSNGLKPNDIIVFDGEQILIGIRQEMDIKVSPDLKNGAVIMRCMLRADVLPIRENHICKITITDNETM